LRKGATKAAHKRYKTRQTESAGREEESARRKAAGAERESSPYDMSACKRLRSMKCVGSGKGTPIAGEREVYRKREERK